jgi:putative intracellular protease/amidase
MYFSILPLLLAALPPASANPKLPTISRNCTQPKHFGVLVFEGFTELDVYGPLAVLAGLNSQFLNYSAHLSIISKTLKPVTTVPGRTPMMNMSHGDFGESVVTTSTFKEILENNGSVPDKGPLDVLLVPGGVGTREELRKEIAFVKAIHPKVRYLAG